MSGPKHKRRDTNQSEIIAALEKVGATVVDLADVGGGCPDILVGYQDKNYLIEIKALEGELSLSQIAFFFHWRGQIAVARSVKEAFRIVGVQYEGKI